MRFSSRSQSCRMWPITMDVGGGQRVREEVAGREPQMTRQIMLRHIRIENRLDRWKVEAAAGQMVVCGGDRDRNRALGAADIDHTAVVTERELGRDSVACGAAEACHRGGETG